MDNIKHKNISVSYKLYILDGDKEHLVEATEANQPFNFMSGMGVTLKDFEDAIQCATAERINADFIITRNVKDFLQSRKALAFTPVEFLERYY